MAEGIPSMHGADISGTTANRPTNAPTGCTYFDTTTSELLVYNGSSWQQAGDSATGDITAGSITGGDASLGIAGLAATAAVADGDGNDGGDITLTAAAGSAGGAHTSNDPDGGDGGSITLTAGAGGAAGAGGSGVAGAPGAILLTGFVQGCVAQTIAMADAAVTLTRVPGTPTGTLLTGNWLLVDAESGTTENLLLPPEADCTNTLLLIKNTGGETVNLQNDAGGALATIATGEVCFAQCDGTTWTVMQFVETT